ncbi:hypothetical protein GGR39_003244 [Novosphingobium fluoreni]|uniref:Transposase n=1 Tax=Novosphingobium fluoreni TaxID=1391222 RepID=A0A7W6FZJ2_9SPHN|nr:hypothetical protein [Novosphingobium fluoreni]MBB3941564.1 hypothetical protein [Novosphingobium fluoreni]
MISSKFAIMPASADVHADKLSEVNPKQMMNALRTALYKMGAATATGWIFVGFHGEFDPVAKVYRPHFHGVAYGGMVQVVDRLRTMPNYKTSRWLPDGSPSPVYRRVQMTRKPVNRLPRPLTYLVQSFWPARALWVSEDGRRRRARQKRRIPEPYHSQVLLWLDKWSINDLTLMIGLRVTTNGLKQTKPVS